MIDYAWSSHQGFISNAEKWEWLNKDFLLSVLSSNKSRRRADYIDFVSQSKPEEVEKFYSLKNLPSVLGCDSFKISNYSTVSSVVERIKARQDKDQSLQKHLEKIAKKLAKSQRQT